MRNEKKINTNWPIQAHQLSIRDKRVGKVRYKASSWGVVGRLLGVFAIDKFFGRLGGHRELSSHRLAVLQNQVTLFISFKNGPEVLLYRQKPRKSPLFRARE
jgi:hypothetical protein